MGEVFCPKINSMRCLMLVFPVVSNVVTNWSKDESDSFCSRVEKVQKTTSFNSSKLIITALSIYVNICTLYVERKTYHQTLNIWSVFDRIVSFFLITSKINYL